MPIAKVKEKFRFFPILFLHSIFNIEKKVCWLSSKQLTTKRLTPNVWSLKSCEKVGFLSNVLSWIVFSFRALSLRRITTEPFVYSGQGVERGRNDEIPFWLRPWYNPIFHIFHFCPFYYFIYIILSFSRHCFIYFVLSNWTPQPGLDPGISGSGSPPCLVQVSNFLTVTPVSQRCL